MEKIRPRERDAIIKSLRAGVVPRIGLQHIQVGRLREVNAIIADLEKIQESGSTARFVVGEFGSGKTFFLTLANVLAHSKNIVTTKADISVEKTLYARDGKARLTFSELMRNLAIKQKPDGGALQHIIETWLSDFMELEGEDRRNKIKNALLPLKEHVAGFDFIEVLNHYVEAYNQGNDDLLDSCLKWLRGEFKNISSARSEISGVKSFINDNNYYDYLKLYSAFFEIAGYDGFLVALDELVSLTRQKTDVRKRNYEAVLRIINDSLQGTNRGLMFLFGGTPDFVFCERKGLHSYGALKTRLARNSFKNENFKDFSGPLIELDNLSPEEYFQLFQNIRNVFANGKKENHLVSDEEINGFLKVIYKKLGAEDHMTARDAIKRFVDVLNILEDNPGASFTDVVVDYGSTESNGSSSQDDNGNVDL